MGRTHGRNGVSSRDPLHESSGKWALRIGRGGEAQDA
eukprot:gene6179-8202_t